jgi:hypothetical protein
VLWLLFLKRRRLFFDHFVLAVELNSFLLGIQFLIVPLLATISTAIYAPAEQFFWDNDFSVFFFLQTSLMLIITATSIKRFYHQNWWWTITKSILFLALYMFIVIGLYKMLLYLLVMLFL